MILHTVRCVSGSGMVPNKATGEVSNAMCVTWADSYRGGMHLWSRLVKAGNPRDVGSDSWGSIRGELEQKRGDRGGGGGEGRGNGEWRSGR